MENERAKLIKQHQEQKKSYQADIKAFKEEESFYNELAQTSQDGVIKKWYINERNYFREAIVYLRSKVREEREIIKALKENK